MELRAAFPTLQHLLGPASLPIFQTLNSPTTVLATAIVLIMRAMSYKMQCARSRAECDPEILVFTVAL